MKRTVIKVGTRGSPLALAQTGVVLARMKQAHPNLRFESVVIKTSGDRIKTAAALRAAGKGLFVKEIERALLNRKIDCAVHSLKDMPSELTEGLDFGAVLERSEAADAYVGRTSTPVDKLPAGSILGTASLRRQALLQAVFRHLKFEDLRGNLDTRLARLNHPRSKLAGIVVAAAGLRRLMNEGAPPHQLLPKNVIVPAAGQGALAVEIRKTDESMRTLLEPIHHSLTAAAIAAERALLRRLEGGCQIPLGVYAEAGDDGLVRLTAAMAMLDGTNYVREEATGTTDDPESVAAALETLMRNAGAEEILAALSSHRRNGQHRPASRSRRPSSRGRARSRR